MGPISLQALSLASAVLTDHKEQIEVLEILQRMKTQIVYSQQDAEEHLKAAWGWDTAGSTMPQSYDRGDGQGAQMIPASTQMSQVSAIASPQQSSSSVNTPYTPMSMPRIDNLPQQQVAPFATLDQTEQYGYRDWRDYNSFTQPFFPPHS
jgi:hypothetical protein